MKNLIRKWLGLVATDDKLYKLTHRVDKLASNVSKAKNRSLRYDEIERARKLRRKGPTRIASTINRG